MVKIISCPIELKETAVLSSLYPFSMKNPPSAGLSECLHYDGEYYLIRRAVSQPDHFICFDSVSEAFCYLRDIYDWQKVFHPFDCLSWVEAFRFFAVGDFFHSGLFNFKGGHIESVYKQLQSQSTAVLDLIRNGRIDVRLPGFCQKNGFVLNDFFVHIFQNGIFQYQAQMLVVDAFSRFFRRKSIEPEIFMNENREIMQELLPAKDAFLDWMRSLTSPLVYRHSKQRDDICAAICAGQKLQLRRDMTLENDWLDLQFRLEDSSDLELLQKLLSEEKRCQLFCDFWEAGNV
jgi:hypothetical protein